MRNSLISIHTFFPGLGDEVELLDKSKRLVCRGVLTAQTEVHGRALNTDWVAVMVQEVVSKGKVEPWPEFPTHSGEVEEGSFVAWPTTHTRTQQSAPIAPRPNLSEPEVFEGCPASRPVCLPGQ